MLELLWTVVTLPFRLLAGVVALLGRLASLVLGFVLMVVGAALMAAVPPRVPTATTANVDAHPFPVPVRAENRDTVPCQHVCGQTADRPRSRRPSLAQHDLPSWPSDSRT